MDTPNPLNPQSSQADSIPAQAVDTAQPEPQTAQPKTTRRKRNQGQKPQTRRAKRRLSLAALKARLQAKLGHLDNARLKHVLIKSIPVGLAILAIVGLGVVVRFLEELRHLPIGVGTL